MPAKPLPSFRPTLLAWALVALGACASSTTAPAESPGGDPLEELDRLAHEARLGLLNSLLRQESDDLARLVDAENRLPAEAREDLLRLARKAADAARVVIGKHPERVEGHLDLAANLALAGLAQGHAKSLLEGLPGKIRAAYEKAIEIDRTFDSAGPLRVKGKFQLGAPWPIGSRKDAGIALGEAVEMAPVPENLLWLGDFHFLEGDLEQAIRLWSEAVATPDDSASWRVDGRVRELAGRRLSLAEGG